MHDSGRIIPKIQLLLFLPVDFVLDTTLTDDSNEDTKEFVAVTLVFSRFPEESSPQDDLFGMLM